jgi:hypothetical protein
VIRAAAFIHEREAHTANTDEKGVLNATVGSGSV